MSRILIIDDEKDLVALLEKKLKASGYEVLTAFDGEMGIQLAKKNAGFDPSRYYDAGCRRL